MIDDYHDVFDYLVDNISARSMLEQLAEEASELSQAALKCIRTFDDTDNPTTIGFLEAMNHIKEEFTDVHLVADLLGIDKQTDVYLRKLYRWIGRLEEHEKGKEEKQQRTAGRQKNESEV